MSEVAINEGLAYCIECAVKHLSDAKTFLLEALGTGKKAPIAPSDIDEVIEELMDVYEREGCDTCEARVEDIGKTLRKVEEGSAKLLLAHLARKHGVPMPRVEFVETDRCPTEPAMSGWYDPKEKKIILCRGGVDYDTVVHEFYHYMADVKGLPNTEEEAKRFTMMELKAFKPRHDIPIGGKMATVREVGLVAGGAFIGKGVEMAVDRFAPAKWAPYVKPAVGAVVLYGATRLGAPYDDIALGAGAYLITTVLDLIPATAPATPAAAPAYKPASAPASTKPATPAKAELK